jgi:DNA (cytosine-5)-methyltransferase 1
MVDLWHDRYGDSVVVTIGSLSSGYGGLEMALSMWLGAGALDVRWHAEIDADASRVLKTWWPEVPNLGSFADEDFWGRAERVHLMCGGIPCQPFSAAGRQLGEADARHLWPFWRRGIELHRPATVVFENVANLVRGKMRPTFDAIVADLLALGYDVRWCLLGACAVGAAHHRHRVFLLACRTRTTPNAAEVKTQTCGQKLAAYVPTPVVTDARGARKSDSGRREGSQHHSGTTLGDMVASLPTPQHRDGSQGGDSPPELGGVRESGAKRAISLPAAAKFLPTPRALDHTMGPASRKSDGGVNGLSSIPSLLPTPSAVSDPGKMPLGAALSLLPSPRGRDGSGGPGHGVNMQGGPGLPAALNMLPSLARGDGSNGGPNQGIAAGDIALSSAVQPERWGKYAEAIARHETVLGRPAPEPTEIGPKGGRRLAAAFSEWLMMLPEGHLTGVLDRNPALARAGNGVVPLQAATALRLLFENLTKGA